MKALLWLFLKHKVTVEIKQGTSSLVEIKGLHQDTTYILLRHISNIMADKSSTPKHSIDTRHDTVRVTKDISLYIKQKEA